MNYSELRSEVNRLIKTVAESIKQTDLFVPSQLTTIINLIESKLYHEADIITDTTKYREITADLDSIQLACENVVKYHKTYDPAYLHLASKFLSSTTVIRNIALNESLKKKKKVKLNETPDIQQGDVTKLANDSLDVTLDSYFKKVSETLDATGTVNKEKSSEGEGVQEFSAVDFSTDIANLLNKINNVIDVDGTVARRAYNYVSQQYGKDAADNVKQILSANFGVEMESSDKYGDDINAPPAAGAGGSGGGAVGGGGAA